LHYKNDSCLSLIYVVFTVSLCCNFPAGAIGHHAVVQWSGGKRETMSEKRILVGDDRALPIGQIIATIGFESSVAATLTRQEVCALMERVGIVPAVSVESAEDALFVAEALAEEGIPILEISMNGHKAIDVISHLAQRFPKTIVGAGSILEKDTASRCLAAGAKFLASDVFVPGVVELAAQEKVAVVPGALTPTEIIAAWNGGADFVKVTPCDAVGGHDYIRSLKTAMPQVRLMAAGGVNQRTALNFIKAGATALGVGKELIPDEAIWLRQTNRIRELARRFLSSVQNGRD
jgi:2-dehydro-3-deoxyphosphogluconate aldolase/(4S)-4-hydroxy-2-oxoglutarate aldolase